MAESTFQPNVTFIPARVKELRCEQPDVCWRPSSDWTHVCILDLGHDGRCGWEGTATTERSDADG